MHPPRIENAFRVKAFAHPLLKGGKGGRLRLKHRHLLTHRLGCPEQSGMPAARRERVPDRCGIPARKPDQPAAPVLIPANRVRGCRNTRSLCRGEGDPPQMGIFIAQRGGIGNCAPACFRLRSFFPRRFPMRGDKGRQRCKSFADRIGRAFGAESGFRAPACRYCVGQMRKAR